MLIKCDICVIGAGSGGLSVAVGAAQMGADVVLVEADKMGGDCLNTGCVPSKSLLSAAYHAHCVRDSSSFGISPQDPFINHKQVHDYVHSVIAAIAPHDSVERMESLGIQVVKGHGSFVNKSTIQAGETKIKAKRFVIATGSSAAVPPIPGLDKVPFFTNETLFENKKKINHLLIIGGGPIGLEMAQAHRRLGSQVSVFEMGSILAKDDPEAVQVVRDALIGEEIALHEGVQIEKITKGKAGISIHCKKEGNGYKVTGSHLLVAAGRRPNVERLGLDKVGVQHDGRGIDVDARLRSSVKKIYAVGDIAKGPQFTHWAGYHAGIVIRNILFSLPAHVDMKALPWVTYTDPELAQVGLSQTQAEKEDIDHTVLKMGYTENDRAQAEGDTRGFVKAIVNKQGKILGATLVGAKAGELIGPWALAVSKGLSAGDMAGVVFPYPTRNELSKRVAGSYYTPKLFGETTRKIVRFLMKFRD